MLLRAENLSRRFGGVSALEGVSLAGNFRSQFDTARRFIQQADDALKARNIVFAGKLADKAATIAAVLVR